MLEKVIKKPGPDHPITIERNPNRVVVTVAGNVIADTTKALVLREARYGAVQYIPREDVNMALLKRSQTQSYCPYKGDASYFGIPVGGERSIDAIWTYETPYEAVAPIKEYLAFYPDKVEIMRTPS